MNLSNPVENKSLPSVHEVSAGGVVLYKGKVLIIRHLRGEWIMPKGHLEEGESDQEAAVREIKEETNIDCELEAPIGITNYQFERDGKIVNKRVVWYLAKPADDCFLACPQREEGIMQLEWVNPQAALDQLTFDLDRRVLEKALEMEGLEF